MARGAAVVHLGQNGDAADGHDAFAVERLQNLRSYLGFDRGHVHRLLEDAVRQL